MDIIAAYREAGTYRGAAPIAGTTQKAVKRVIERHDVGAPRRRGCRGAVSMAAWPSWWRSGWARRRAGSRRSGCCQRPGRRGMAGRTGTSAGLVAEQKALWRRDHHRGRRPAVWEPGEHLVRDWTHHLPQCLGHAGPTARAR